MLQLEELKFILEFTLFSPRICQGIFLPGKRMELHELINLFNRRIINVADSRRQVLVNTVSAT